MDAARFDLYARRSAEAYDRYLQGLLEEIDGPTPAFRPLGDDVFHRRPGPFAATAEERILAVAAALAHIRSR